MISANASDNDIALLIVAGLTVVVLDAKVFPPRDELAAALDDWPSR